jgi:hypothetical protein
MVMGLLTLDRSRQSRHEGSRSGEKEGDNTGGLHVDGRRVEGM